MIKSTFVSVEVPVMSEAQICSSSEIRCSHCNEWSSGMLCSFFYVLPNNVIGTVDWIALNGRIISQFGKMWKEVVVSGVSAEIRTSASRIQARSVTLCSYIDKPKYKNFILTSVLYS
jgi:hypothetical protein